MSDGASLSEHQVLADRLMNLPSRIVQNHDLEDLPQIVLHYLGHNDCFELEKAAYFANNPDFNYFLGAAGYCEHECSYDRAEDIWSDPSRYHEHMKDAKFHKTIKQILQHKAADLEDTNSLKNLANELDIKSPNFVSWDLKHGNNGVLIYSRKSAEDWKDKMLPKATTLFAFCPL